MKDPSCLTSTARTLPSVSVNWKIPGLYCDTVTEKGCEGKLSAVATSWTVPTGTVQGTCTAMDSWPFSLATHNIGAGTPPNWTVTPFTCICGAMGGAATPCSPDANPVPETMARLHGE